jgi:isocitrate dehydrogenase (NAD+)
VSDAVLAIPAGGARPREFRDIPRRPRRDSNAGATDVLPEDTVQAIQERHVALKGPCSTPVGRGFSSVNVALRRTLNLYAALRPVRSVPGVRTRFENVDLIVVRENTEGLYSGIENLITDGVVVSMKVATRSACHRIAHWTFRYATHRRRKKISVFHKANIMKMSDGMLLEESRKVYSRDYPNIDYQEVIIDAATMKMVQDPTQFDICCAKISTATSCLICVRV